MDTSSALDLSYSPSDAVSVTSLEIREKTFGPLLDITDESIISLALKVRNQISPEHFQPSPKHRLVSRLGGSYNLVFVVEFVDGLRYVVRIPGFGWGDRFTDKARKCFESQLIVMRLIHDRTTIPVPAIYAFDASQNNKLGTPWIVMSFISGVTLGGGWFDETGPTPLEDRRQQSLKSLAAAMSQLHKFQFDKIGCLEFTDGSKESDEISIGPICELNMDDPNDENYCNITQSGPFDSSRSYMLHEFSSRENDPDGWGLAAYKLTSIMLSYLPKSSPNYSFEDEDGAETFVLCHPDFDSQNIMIDEKGNLTGLIDWDNARTYPRFLGYCRYPSFLTPDWDPLMYGYSGLPRYLSPEELVRYRKIYSNKMIQMLGGKDDAIFAAKSHIFEAVGIASSVEMNRADIARKFIREAIPEVLPEQDDYDILYNMIRDELEPELMERLEKGIKKLLSVERPLRDGQAVEGSRRNIIDGPVS